MDFYRGKGFDELRIGETFRNTWTLTETHIVLGAGLFNDFNPLHVNETFAARSRYGGRIAHGYLTSNAMAALLGMVFHSTAIAYVEHRIRFTHPVRAGDTLTIEWRIAELSPKPKLAGGLVVLSGACINQNGSTVAEAEAKMLVHDACPKADS